jgi:TonB-dependent SusC/RagA subfamily outer membrane receptor
MWSHRPVVATLRTTLAALAVLLLVGGVMSLDAQQSVTLLGTVRDYETGRPLVGARVAIVGSDIMADTDGVGRYQLINLWPGPYRLRIEHAGYGTLVQEIRVGTDSLTVAHFHLPNMAILLDELTIQAKPPDDPASPVKVEPGSSAGDAISAGDVIDRSVPGINVLRGSGQVGSGSRFRIRGIKSFVGGGAPLVFVDGVRVDFAMDSPGIVGLAGASVLDLVHPSMIERIDVLKGAEASKYGLGSANGVILITTKGRRFDR